MECFSYNKSDLMYFLRFNRNSNALYLKPIYTLRIKINKYRALFVKSVSLNICCIKCVTDYDKFPETTYLCLYKYVKTLICD